MIRTQRQAYLSELATLAELGKQYREDPLVALLVEAAVLHTEANLRVLDLAYDRVDHLAGLAPAMQAEEQEVQQAR